MSFKNRNKNLFIVDHLNCPPQFTFRMTVIKVHDLYFLRRLIRSRSSKYKWNITFASSELNQFDDINHFNNEYFFFKIIGLYIECYCNFSLVAYLVKFETSSFLYIKILFIEILSFGRKKCWFYMPSIMVISAALKYR